MPTVEDVLTAVRRRAATRYEALRDERYRLTNTPHIVTAPQGRLAEVKLLMDMHETLLYRALNDTSISVTLMHRPRSAVHADTVLNHILDIDLVDLGYPKGTVGVTTAHTTHTYVLDWDPR